MASSKSLLGVWGYLITVTECFAVIFWKMLYDNLVTRVFVIDINWSLFYSRYIQNYWWGKRPKWSEFGVVDWKRGCLQEELLEAEVSPTCFFCVFLLSAFFCPSTWVHIALPVGCGQGKWKILAAWFHVASCFLFLQNLSWTLLCVTTFLEGCFFCSRDLGERGCTL